MSEAQRSPISLGKQADIIEALVKRCRMKDGDVAGKAWLLLEAEQVQDLKQLADRLRRMSRYEAQIKALVVRGQ